MMHANKYDVIIVGGSYAGLSAAMTLGRALRNVIVLDNGKPCNRYVPHAHNFVTQDGKTPAEVARSVIEQVEHYTTVKLVKTKAIEGKISAVGFGIKTEEGQEFEGRQLLFATGKKDIMPDINGFEACWGKSIAQCPYCHGYETRDVETGVLANGDAAFELARLIYNWSKKLVVLTNGPCTISAVEMAKLRERNIEIVEKDIKYIDHDNGMMKKVVFDDDSSMLLKMLYNHPHSEQHSNIPEKMGCEITEHGLIKIDESQKTTVPGIFAAGDNSYIFRSLSVAIAAGTKAGVLINQELVKENF